MPCRGGTGPCHAWVGARNCRGGVRVQGLARGSAGASMAAAVGRCMAWYVGAWLGCRGSARQGIGVVRPATGTRLGLQLHWSMIVFIFFVGTQANSVGTAHCTREALLHCTALVLPVFVFIIISC